MISNICNKVYDTTYRTIKGFPKKPKAKRLRPIRELRKELREGAQAKARQARTTIEHAHSTGHLAAIANLSKAVDDCKSQWQVNHAALIEALLDLSIYEAMKEAVYFEAEQEGKRVLNKAEADVNELLGSFELWEGADIPSNELLTKGYCRLRYAKDDKNQVLVATGWTQKGLDWLQMNRFELGLGEDDTGSL